MESHKTVFIISKYLMFQDGLKSLLSQQGEVELVGWAASPDQAIGQIKTLQPDVVILDSTSMPANMIARLERIFWACPQIKLINVNLHNNHLSIYQRIKQKAVTSYQVLGWKVESFTDLLKAIGGSGSPPSHAAMS